MARRWRWVVALLGMTVVASVLLWQGVWWPVVRPWLASQLDPLGGESGNVIQSLDSLVALLLGAGNLGVALWQWLRGAASPPVPEPTFGLLLAVPPEGLTVAPARDLWRRMGRLPSAPVQEATESYLAYLFGLYRYLSLKGMGVSDRVPLQLPLLEMYVPLRARIELPDGEAWTRSLSVGGRALGEEGAAGLGERLSSPQSLLPLLRDQDGLILLGDPGAGKSTFLRVLALYLAAGQGQALGLGVHFPILLPLAAYAEALDGSSIDLEQFIAAYYRRLLGERVPMAELLAAALSDGGALVLLDGLDEVREERQRRRVVEQVEHFYALHRPRGNKFVLTSRIVGYREVRPASLEGLVEATLVDFDEEEITRFVQNWTEALERAAGGATVVARQEAAREQAELLRAIRHNPGVARLAVNPLLLTILALMKRQGVALPERRVQLYQAYITTLIRTWNLARAGGRESGALDELATLRVLAPLALWMHESAPGAGLVKQRLLLAKLADILERQGHTKPGQAAEAFLADVRYHTGLLLDRGGGQYGFIHLTFQEYLAAIAIARQGQEGMAPVVETLAAHVGESQWREVSLLTVGYVGIVEQREEAAGAVVRALVEQRPGEAGEAVILAGEAVADAWPGGVPLADKGQVVAALLDTLRDAAVRPVRRAAAGALLVRLGDPRLEATSLAGMELCWIPAGRFWMGDDAQERASPAGWYEVGYDYWLARYPVTVAQWREFVARSGHSLEDTDSMEGLATAPARWVGWSEALAFTHWLTGEGRTAGWLPEGWQVVLPSEPEWEKGARGGEMVPTVPLVRALARLATPVAQVRLQVNQAPRRAYPWGNAITVERANYDETGIRGASAVGCFPGGASPYGCEELSGNVWEWTRSAWGKNLAEPTYGYPYQPADGREQEDLPNTPRVLRGGAFHYFGWAARCAFRYGYHPLLRNYVSGFRVAVSPCL